VSDAPQDELNAAQRDVIALLGARPDERPVFPDGLRGRIADDLSEAVAPIAGGVDPDDPIFVNKRRLAQVHGCQALYTYEQSTPGFDWSIPVAIGTVAHKAIELSIHWRGSPYPIDLTDEAVGRLSADDRGLGLFLREMPDGDRAQLRSDVNDRVASFMECFPPLKSRWRPVTESRVRAELLGGRVIAAGKVDLTLGNPQGQVAGKVIIDLKTGRRRSEHRDDLRFYALLETLKVGTPPRMAASYYLDEGRFVEEVITEAVLDAAITRFVHGLDLIMELTDPEMVPIKRPSPACRWCPLLEDCHDGASFLNDDELT